MRGRKPKPFAVSTPNRRIAGIAQSRRNARDRVQHRLNICPRTGITPKDLTGRCLLLNDSLIR